MTDRDKIIETMKVAIRKERFWTDPSSRKLAEVAYDALQASGMAVVPVEPTREMYRAGNERLQMVLTSADSVWSAMLSASPSFNPAVQEKKDE